MKNATRLREMNLEQLTHELASVRNGLLDKALRRVGESSDGGPSRREIRKDVARVLTMMREKSVSDI